VTIVEAAAWLLLLVAVAGQVARYLTVANQPIIIVATLAPYLALAALLSAGAFWAVASIPGLALSLGITAFAAFLARPFLHQRPTAPTARLTVMTCNAYFGRGDAAQLLDVAREARADLLAVQEITPELTQELHRLGIEELFPHSVLAPAPLWAGAALWSRFPLREQRIEVVDQLHRVAAVVGLAAEPSPDDPVVSSLHIHAPWPPSPEPWIEQLHALRDELLAQARPYIAMGDFNATLDHAPFRHLLGAGCTDAAASSRAWAATTYPGHRRAPALIAIDHVLTRGFVGTHVRTTRIKGSDHLAVIAQLADYPT
jgi:endonuclease/exonuclease/phosphatase (EEP) superfamily protein YafD